ncbi:MAG: LysM peptidoglycan-binding domain-containing protein, partial [Deltaproteobacteria bacterium]|nr:LysM peptidoglycan-binding domain-containing protein [Deltaproteobacteria bacterium]
LSYLKDLHDMFGSWALAMAAYNCGEDRVKKEISEQGVNDYYLLNLPLETERYIFRILAAKLILTNPKAYGYDPAQIKVYPPFEVKTVVVKLKRSVHFRLVAQAAKSYFKEIKELNPSRRGYYLPAGTHWLRLPAQGAEGFEGRLAALMKKNSQPRSASGRYVVRPGDNLSQVAQKLEVSVERLKQRNKLRSTVIRPGQVLYY